MLDAPLLNAARKTYRGVRRVARALRADQLSQTIVNIGSPVHFVAGFDDSRKQRNYYYYGNQTALVETHNGHYIMLDLRDLSLTPHILKTGWWEPWNEILLRSLLKPGMAYINAGTNVGFHFMLGASLVGSTGRAFGFEANPHIFGLLRRSVYISGLMPQSTLYNAAVFDEPGESDFLFVVEHQGGAGLGDTDENYMNTKRLDYTGFIDGQGKADPGVWSAYNKTTVTRVTIDATVGEQTKELNLIHMDIERSEGPALVGAMELIGRSPDVKIIVEQSPVLPPAIHEKYQKALDFLVKQKFKFYVIQPPPGCMYTNPPSLEEVSRDNLSNLPHCDVFMTR